MLLWRVRAPHQFPQAEPPVWINWWQADWPAEDVPGRYQRRGLPYLWWRAALEQPQAPALLARQQQGAEALAAWLQRLLEHGLPCAHYLFTSLWQSRIRRLEEYDLPGLAAALGQVEARCHAGALDPDALLAALGELYSLTHAFVHLPQLPAAEQPAVRLRAGVNQLDRGWVRGMQPGVADTWLVLNQRTEQDARGRWWGWYHRATWLWGATTGRYALVVETDINVLPPPKRILPWGQYQGILHFYPGAGPLRAIPGKAWEWQETEEPQRPLGGSPWQLAYTYAAAVEEQPWLSVWPVTLSPMLPVLTGLTDVQLVHPLDQGLVPLRGELPAQWQLLATGGGGPLAVFGEWDGRALLPLAQWILPASPTTPPAL
ncbi:hypothetical protein [Hymenobacter sp. UV11]|uniref:hypothetical protein n=1 Tax=Hymenobacter sp. UV11 TaxID=1849735 RepID=UPI001076B1AF|nr:hypothetical protein [Hymenobacter sp. UV11]